MRNQDRFSREVQKAIILGEFDPALFSLLEATFVGKIVKGKRIDRISFEAFPEPYDSRLTFWLHDDSCCFWDAEFCLDEWTN